MQVDQVDGKVLETWDAGEVHAAFEAGEVVIIDVRSPQEFMLEHIGGSLLMPMSSFEAAGLPGQGDKRIVLMCAGGVRSERMARVALDAGFDRIAHMGGGFGAWKAAKLPYLGTDFTTGATKQVR
ncbi:rhodanese-like domain-containing protein [Roseovarius sp. LXJ103]|uniref:rhodanese-like domain-containing protein n=1 Tax=Roseovarius carneus TaxID=2853164 RepID=UPI000D620897|nr:rhodanese-like domain-containing protein [Roseovarius carneus]MBZ8118416.1 rhodanese-like domain-containing protein [Roseovarius carneus]PWE35878.1 rhodanese-like domain-containing protein [Pelagicola sp. LXJ1103]